MTFIIRGACYEEVERHMKVYLSNSMNMNSDSVLYPLDNFMNDPCVLVSSHLCNDFY